MDEHNLCDHTPSEKRTKRQRGIDFIKNDVALYYYPCYEVSRCKKCGEYIRPSRTSKRVNLLLDILQIPLAILCWLWIQRIWKTYIFSFAAAGAVISIIRTVQKYILGSSNWSVLEYTPKTEEEFVKKEQERLKERNSGYKILGIILAIVLLLAYAVLQHYGSIKGTLF